MRVEAVLHDPPLAHISELARRAEQLGFDGLILPEISRDPFILAALAGEATSRIRVSTAVALAFPRSPTTTAYSARTLHDLTAGRFGLGLGTQVRGHIERRFGVPWSAPVARMREYIGAVRTVLTSWDSGDPLSFDGALYRLSLMTPTFSPGPSHLGPIPIHIGAVNPLMIQLAGEVCDGVRLHPFCTPRYVRDVILPNLLIGAARSGRPLSNLDIVSGGFIATGVDALTVSRQREAARRQIAFYASTRSYAPILAIHDWQHIGTELRRLIAKQRWEDLGALVTDEMLDACCIAAPYEAIADLVAQRLAGLVDTVTLELPRDPSADEQLAATLVQLARI
jgi:probable F420-dependent oxidoreductase